MNDRASPLLKYGVVFMTDKEFEEIYGRPPVKRKIIVKKRKIYWNRIIIALLVLIGIIWGIVQLFSNIFAKPANVEADNKESNIAAEVSNSESENSNSEIIQEQNQFTVCIDPGHGDYDVGTTDASGNRLEKDDNLAISLLVEKHLKEKGVNVVMTRNDDTFLELPERCTFANVQKADFLVCMHRNSYDGDIGGIEIWVHNKEPEEDTILSQNIMTECDKLGYMENRGVQYGYVGNPNINYYINADTVMPSCLVELGFLTNENDNKLFDEHIDEYAQAVADGIIKTAVQLGVVDEKGNRLVEGQLKSANKPINNADSSSSSNGGDNSKEVSQYGNQNENLYNLGESEYKAE